MSLIAPYRKAILAFVLPAAGAIGAAMADGNLTGAEVVIAAGAGLVAGVAVYGTPNADA